MTATITCPMSSLKHPRDPTCRVKGIRAKRSFARRYATDAVTLCTMRATSLTVIT